MVGGEEYRHLVFIRENMAKVVTMHAYYYFQHQMEAFSPFSKEKMGELCKLIERIEAAGWIRELDRNDLISIYNDNTCVIFIV